LTQEKKATLVIEEEQISGKKMVNASSD